MGQPVRDEQKELALLRTAIDAIPEGFVIYDPEDRLVICNDAYRQLYARSAPAMTVGATFEQILRYGLENGQYPEAGNTTASREAWLAKRLAAHRNTDRRLVQKIGSKTWLQIEERELPGGEIVGIRSDISELVRSRASTDQLGLIIERCDHEVFIVDLDSQKFITVNHGARQNLGYDMAELQGMTPLHINSEYDEKTYGRMLEPLLRGEVDRIEIETRHRRKDGSEYPCSLSVYVDRAEDGDVLVAFGEDLTQHRNMELENARQKRDLDSLVSNLPDILTRATPDLVLTYANDRFAKFLGMPIKDILGRSLVDFAVEENRYPIRAGIAALTPEAPLRYATETIVDAAGRECTIRWSNLMVFEDGKPVEVVSIGRDVSDLSAANAALQAVNDELQGFAYAASHDLRSPIQTMRSLLDVLAEDHLDEMPEDVQAIVRRLTGVANRMVQLSNGVLDYARISGTPPVMTEFDVGMLLDGIIADMEAEFSASGAKIETGRMPMLRAVRPQLGQVLQNLIGNALKFHDPENIPKIRVDARRLPDGRYAFSVRDNGIGLSEDEAEEIFTPFQRLHGRHRFAGSGLGLTICRKIINAHGGSIFAKPNKDGPGTTFTFTIQGKDDE